ncbi:hypothetical protein P879_06393 [Paragonimus westermani]|uniref:Major vault protein n=1 Tax=Paragonimus westermani TaxID=34504 RepID=A0A8T0DLD1_9TREM|nr:hypothetical protein P879_06393 [Paragonimus westermani]
MPGYEGVDDVVLTASYADIHITNKQLINTHVTRLNLEPGTLVFGPSQVITVTRMTHCLIRNSVMRDDSGVPIIDKNNQVKINLGDDEYRFHQDPFALYPEEQLIDTIKELPFAAANCALRLRAVVEFLDVESVGHVAGDEWLSEGPDVPELQELPHGGSILIGCDQFRQPGAQWMIRGPIEYVPPVEVEVVASRSLIPLDRNEGIYVRNTRTGQIRAVIGEAYMLNEEEELWKKKLPNEVVRLLQEAKDPLADRGEQEDSYQIPIDYSLDLTRVVTLPVPHNAAVQIYDYRAKRARVEFGPTLMMLGPDEQCTQLCLSGGKPKMPNKIRSLCLLLGPDFCTDIVVVETADHARLSLQLSYNWYFEVPENCSQSEAAKLFSVPDFIGDACKAIASRIRGHVAAVPFDDFHKNSARIVTSSVFGLDEDGRLRDRFTFPQNNLHITSIDIQCVEPLDSRARESLEKSVQLAIEIRTNSQEATARHEANRLEQETLGALHRQNILDEAAAECARRDLVDMRVQLAEIESTGKAKAEAQSQAEAAKIVGQSSVESAKLLSEANRIETDGEVDRLQKTNETDLQFQSAKNELTMRFQAEQTEIEVNRFISMVDAVGSETLAAIVSAGGEQASRLLSCIGLESSLVTNGKNPVNLLATAHGLVGQMSRKCVEQTP